MLKLRYINSFKSCSIPGTKFPKYLSKTSTKIDFVKSILPSSSDNDCDISADLRLAISSLPDLLEYPPHLWHQTFDIFQKQGFKLKKIIFMIVRYPNLLHSKDTHVDNALNLWRNCQFGENQVHTLLEHAPVLIEAAESNINNCIPKLEYIIGNKKRVSKLLMNSPNVVFENWDHVEEKLNYLMKNMRIEISEIVKSSALNRNLSEIKCRHLFLDRLGVFINKKTNRSSELCKRNPSLNTITDTTDHTFANEVAKITYEEFAVFKELYQKEFEKNFDDEELDLDEI